MDKISRRYFITAVLLFCIGIGIIISAVYIEKNKSNNTFDDSSSEETANDKNTDSSGKDAFFEEITPPDNLSNNPTVIHQEAPPDEIIKHSEGVEDSEMKNGTNLNESSPETTSAQNKDQGKVHTAVQSPSVSKQTDDDEDLKKIINDQGKVNTAVQSPSVVKQTNKDGDLQKINEDNTGSQSFSPTPNSNDTRNESTNGTELNAEKEKKEGNESHHQEGPETNPTPVTSTGNPPIFDLQVGKHSNFQRQKPSSNQETGETHQYEEDFSSSISNETSDFDNNIRTTTDVQTLKSFFKTDAKSYLRVEACRKFFKKLAGKKQYYFKINKDRNFIFGFTNINQSKCDNNEEFQKKIEDFILENKDAQIKGVLNTNEQVSFMILNSLWYDQIYNFLKATIHKYEISKISDRSEYKFICQSCLNYIWNSNLWDRKTLNEKSHECLIVNINTEVPFIDDKAVTSDKYPSSF